MLKNLESKVREQDAYWTKVVSLKDNEIENLKNMSEKSWAGKYNTRNMLNMYCYVWSIVPM